jgi:hypothetical protein
MRVLSILFVFTFGLLLSGCQPSGPSVLKIYVRNNSNILEQFADVLIILEPNEYVSEHFVTKRTNESGFVLFDLDELFDKYGKAKEKLAFFKVYITAQDGKQGTGTVRARGHNTAVHTIFLVE